MRADAVKTPAVPAKTSDRPVTQSKRYRTQHPVILCAKTELSSFEYHYCPPPPLSAEPLGATAADLLPGLLPGGGNAIAGSGNPDVVAAMMYDASPLLNVMNAGVGDGVAPPASDGGVSAAWMMMVSTAAPGDAYLATGLFGIAAAVIAVGAG